MKRILVAMTLMGAALVVASGVAWALTVNCQVGALRRNRRARRAHRHQQAG